VRSMLLARVASSRQDVLHPIEQLGLHQGFVTSRVLDAPEGNHPDVVAVVEHGGHAGLRQVGAIQV
jgi:hypothetical protein